MINNLKQMYNSNINRIREELIQDAMLIEELKNELAELEERITDETELTDEVIEMLFLRHFIERKLCICSGLMNLFPRITAVTVLDRQEAKDSFLKLLKSQGKLK